MTTVAALDWSKIDTVLLDMDGTLLDLRFDNWFWQELIPSTYGAALGVSPVEARRLIEPKFLAARGTLRWYCIDHWSQEFGIDIAKIKRAALARIGYLPGAEEFLLRLKLTGKRRVLVTNAHPVTLAIKDERVGLMAHFDACYSTHPFELPKEHAGFWPRLQAKEPFVSERTLFVDDCVAVIKAAHEFGIGWVRTIRRPDSSRPPQATGSYPAIDQVADLL